MLAHRRRADGIVYRHALTLICCSAIRTSRRQITVSYLLLYLDLQYRVPSTAWDASLRQVLCPLKQHSHLHCIFSGAT
jgi:hypothetical protein